MQAIPACTVDCGKFDSDDTSDFGFFDKLNTLNVRNLAQTGSLESWLPCKGVVTFLLSS